MCSLPKAHASHGGQSWHSISISAILLLFFLHLLRARHVWIWVDLGVVLSVLVGRSQLLIGIHDLTHWWQCLS